MKSNKGGKRNGAGRKPEYNEPTTTVSFRVPVSKVDGINSIVNEKLSEWRF